MLRFCENYASSWVEPDLDKRNIFASILSAQLTNNILSEVCNDARILGWMKLRMLMKVRPASGHTWATFCWHWSHESDDKYCLYKKFFQISVIFLSATVFIHDTLSPCWLNICIENIKVERVQEEYSKNVLNSTQGCFNDRVEDDSIVYCSVARETLSCHLQLVGSHNHLMSILVGN